MPKLNKIVLLSILVLSMSCSKEEGKIYKLDGFSIETISEGRYSLSEYFIIKNPPKKKSDFLCLLKHFNDTTLKIEKEEKVIASWTRTFYRETNELNENFKVVGRKDLSHYYKDIVADFFIVSYKGVSGHYRIYQNSIIGEKFDIEDLPSCNNDN